ncbi:MAG: O-antigen ligase family protein [Pelovirga sp.]
MTSLHSRFQPIAGYVFVALTFLFPIGMGIVQHWGSALFIVMAVISVLVLGKDWRCYDKNIKLLYAAMGLFVVVSALGLVNTENFSSGLSRLEKLLFLVLAYPLAVAIRRLDLNLFLPFLYGLLVSGPVYAFAAYYYNHYVNISRATGFYSSIIFGTAAMTVALLVAAGQFGAGSPKCSRLIILFSFICAVIAAIASGTRGVWLAFPVVLTLWMVVSLRSLTLKKATVLFVLIFSVVLVFSQNEYAHVRVQQVFSDLQSFRSGEKVNTSVGVRLMLWEEAVSIWHDNPFLGTGPGDFRFDIKNRIDSNQTPLQKGYTHAHNIFLHALATTGVVGCAGLIVFVFVVPGLVFVRMGYDKLSRNLSAQSVMGLTLLLAFAVFGLTEGWTIHTPMVSSFSFMLLILVTSQLSSPE